MDLVCGFGLKRVSPERISPTEPNTGENCLEFWFNLSWVLVFLVLWDRRE